MHRIALLLLVSLLLAGSASGLSDAEFQVVVHASNPSSHLTKSEIADIFLKKQTRWSDGREIVPVDQKCDRPIRQGFTKLVYGKPVEMVRGHSQSQALTGRATPPIELQSDSAVLNYVRSHETSIGYVASGAELGHDLKALPITP